MEQCHAPRSLGRALPALALAVALFAGCGAGAARVPTSTRAHAAARKGPTPPGEQTWGARLSRSQLIASAALICARTNAQLAAVRPKSATVAETLRIVPRNVRLERRAASELARLQPPASMASGWHALVADVGALAGDLELLVGDARRNDAAAAKTLAAAKARVHRSLSSAAARAGLGVCGKIGVIPRGSRAAGKAVGV
jgi:hypothetical protein